MARMILGHRAFNLVITKARPPSVSLRSKALSSLSFRTVAKRREKSAFLDV
jgi:hypothetical protein